MLNLHQVDKVYLGTPTKIAIVDHEKERTFVIIKDELPDLGEITHLNSLLMTFNPFD